MPDPDSPFRNTPFRPVAQRPVAVVLGAGRTGTSLLMQALAALGVRVSGELIPPRSDNPRGFFEDVPIVRIQANLLRALGAWPFHPLPADWLSHPATAEARLELGRLLAAQLEAPGLWAFKDPRTAAFLPLWQALFTELGVTPKYILALRHPGSVVASFQKAYGTPAAEAEAVWLRRTRDALAYTGADCPEYPCHIVHYEDWFTREADLLTDLAEYLELEPPAAPPAIAQPDLNRSLNPDYRFQNPETEALYAALAMCRGSCFDREALRPWMHADPNLAAATVQPAYGGGKPAR
ncbi:MAG: sulfotransferase [Pseudomonadota bacterium]